MIRKNALNLVRAFSKINDNNKVLIIKVRLPRNNNSLNNCERILYKEFLTITENSDNIYIFDRELDILDLYKLYSKKLNNNTDDNDYVEISNKSN